MSRSTPLVLALTLSLALAGCGDDGSSDANPFGGEGPTTPYGFDPSKLDTSTRDGLEAAKRMGEQIRKGVANARLDEAMLEKLYELQKRLDSAKDDTSKAMAVFREIGLDPATYGASLLKFQALKRALRKGPEKIVAEYDEAKQGIEELKAKIAGASGDAKQALEQQVPMAEMMLKGLETNVEQAKLLENTQYRALIEKWVKKFDGLDD